MLATTMEQDRLKEIVKEAQPRLREIAAAIGVSYPMFNAYLYREDVRIPEEARRRLAQYLEAHGRKLQDLATELAEDAD